MTKLELMRKLRDALHDHIALQRRHIALQDEHAKLLVEYNRLLRDLQKQGEPPPH